MFRIKSSLYYVWIVLLILSSCSTSAESATKSTPLVQNTMSVTPSQVPTSEVIVTSTTSAESFPMVKTQCASDVYTSQNIDLPGIIVLKQPGKSIDFQAADESGQLPVMDFGFYLFDPNEKKPLKSINDGLLEQVSPDGKYLAYVHNDASGDKEFLGILDSNGKVINDFSLFIDGAWQSYYNWQNSEAIRLVAAYETVETRLLNPFTKTHSPLKNDWDHAYSPANPYQDKIVDWKFDRMATKTFNVYGANILYDPTLTRVVYPKEDGVVSLLNVDTEAELANSHFTDWGRIPSWSPNGEYLAILNREGNADEFYLITKDGGDFRRITNFAKEFGNVLIPEYTWSPDGKRIAFWLNLEESDLSEGALSELAILDVSSGQVTRSCILGISTDTYEPRIMNHPEPVWSPDGRYIIITQWDNADSPINYFVSVIDTQSGAVEKISENTAPVGWMTNQD